MSTRIMPMQSPQVTTRVTRLIAMSAVVVALAITYGALTWSRPAARTLAPQSVSTVDGAAPLAAAEPATSTVRSSSASATGQPTQGEPWPGAANWQAEYGCMGCPGAANIAHSAEEAAWLHRNGFDGRNQRLALEKLSKAELRARFDAGDLVAGAIYLERMADNREKGARQFANQLAARGSILVLYKLAGYYARGPHANKYFFAAALHLAQMRGDRWAINELKAWQPTMRYDLVDTIVDEKVSILLSNIEQARLEHGYPPLTIDIRPAAPEVDQTAIAPPRG